MVIRRAWWLAAIAASGGLCAVGASLGPLGPAATCLCLVPFIVALDRAATWRGTLALAAAMAAAFVGVVFPWFPATVVRYSGASSAGVWALFVLASPVIAPQVWVFAIVRRLCRGSLGAPFAASLSFVAVDSLSPKLFMDTLGIGLYPSSALRQGADLAGVTGLTVLALAVNEIVAEAVKRGLAGTEAEVSPRPGPGGGARRWRSVARPLGAAAAVLGLALIYGAVRIRQVDGREVTRTFVAGAVQANLTAYDKLLAERGAFDAMDMIVGLHLRSSVEILREGPVDVMVWPETVYPTTFGAPRGEGARVFEDALRDFVRETRVPLVFGAYEANGGVEHNAMFFLLPRGEGLSVESYRKHMLFPLTEHVPAWLDSESLRRALPWAGRWSRGPGPRTIDVSLGEKGSIRVLPLICYDAVAPGYVADGAALGADVIVTLSNDAWFPGEGAARLHLASAALRSVESRLPQLRATVSGISAFIAPTGEIVAESGWERPAKMRFEVPVFAREAPPARAFSRWIGEVAALVSLGLVLDVARRARLNPGDATREKRAPRRRKR